MIIKQAIIEQMPIINNLANDIWWPTYKNVISEDQISFMLDKMYSVKALEQQFEDRTTFLLAERDSEYVGFAAYSLLDSTNKVFKIHKLYILPSEQGKGTGKKFVEYIADIAKNEGGKILELNVNRSNPAFNFYKKIGFEIYQSVDIPYYQFVLNDYIMRMKL